MWVPELPIIIYIVASRSILGGQGCEAMHMCQRFSLSSQGREFRYEVRACIVLLKLRVFIGGERDFVIFGQFIDRCLRFDLSKSRRSCERKANV